ncbi:MAG: winged helix-turn-helix transcriptional regulator [Candidatus Thorarchaeota archaeon]
MDLLDKRILTTLTRNCRASYQELSREIGFTPNAVRKRVDKLIENGTLYSFTIRPTLNTMNANIALTLIETDGTEDVSKFLDSFGENEMIGEVNPIVTKERGYYLILSDYIGSNGVLELSTFLRKLDHVENVEIHPVITDPLYHGRAVEFKPLELRVMKYLIENAKMSIVELSEKTGLSARRVRNILDNLQEGGGVSFSIRWNTAAAGALRFFLAITYDPRNTKHEEVIEMIQEQYPREFWLYWVSTSHPMIFSSFTVDSIDEVRTISIEMRENPQLVSVDTWICYPPRKFKTYPERWFEEFLRDI